MTMRTLKDYEHLRPKAGEPEIVLRDVIVEGHRRDIVLLPEGEESIFLGRFGSGAPAEQV